MTKSLFNLNGVSIREIAKRTWAEIRADDVFGRAAQLAYYFFLALFPFLICVIASLSLFGTADRGRSLLLALFARFLPAPAFQLINSTFIDIIQASGPLKMSFGVIFSLWSASMGMTAIMDTLNAAYRVQETRSLIKQYAVAIGLTCTFALLLIAAILAVILKDSIIASLSSRSWLNAITLITLTRTVQWAMGLALLLLAFAITYYFAPNLKHPQWHWITPGAAASVALLILVSVGLRVYLRFYGGYTSYGSLGAVIVLLLWFYMSGIAVLSGSVLNGVLEGLDKEPAPENEKMPDSLPASSELSS